MVDDKLLIFDGPDQIAYVQACARRGALSLEVHGMKRNGRSAFYICKVAYGFEGTKSQVLRQMNELIATMQAKARETDG